MILFVKMAIRNIGRNRSRSLFTIIMTSTGLAALLFLWGVGDGIHVEMVENTTSLFTGHIQIHGAGFDRRMKLENTLPDATLVKKIVSEDPLVKGWSPKVRSEALLGTTGQSRGIILNGIQPSAEVKVSRLNEKIFKGSYLTDDDDRAIVIGHKLADRLEVSLGDKVVALVQEKKGALGGTAYRIKGIFKADSDFLDLGTAYVTLKSAQNIFGLEPEELSEINIRLKSIKDLDQAAARYRAYLKEPYEALTWPQIAPDIDGWIRWDNIIIGLILTVISGVIGIGVMNTVLMSVLERTKEFGILKAVGMAPRYLVFLVFLETFFLTLIGIIVGIVFGLGLIKYFGMTGIPMNAFQESMTTSFMPLSIKPYIEIRHLVSSVFLMTFLPVLISFYPAIRAARLEPVKAIYHA